MDQREVARRFATTAELRRMPGESTFHKIHQRKNTGQKSGERLVATPEAIVTTNDTPGKKNDAKDSMQSCPLDNGKC